MTHIPPVTLRKIAVPDEGAESLFGTYDENLKLLEGLFNVQIRTSGHEVIVEGEAADVARTERVLEQLRALPEGVSEFMTHPGYYDEDLAYSRYGKQRETEIEGLTDPAARELIAREGIRLASFSNL